MPLPPPIQDGFEELYWRKPVAVEGATNAYVQELRGDDYGGPVYKINDLMAALDERHNAANLEFPRHVQWYWENGPFGVPLHGPGNNGRHQTVSLFCKAIKWHINLSNTSLWTRHHERPATGWLDYTPENPNAVSTQLVVPRWTHAKLAEHLSIPDNFLQFTPLRGLTVPDGTLTVDESDPENPVDVFVPTPVRLLYPAVGTDPDWGGTNKPADRAIDPNTGQLEWITSDYGWENLRRVVVLLLEKSPEMGNLPGGGTEEGFPVSAPGGPSFPDEQGRLDHWFGTGPHPIDPDTAWATLPANPNFGNSIYLGGTYPGPAFVVQLDRNFDTVLRVYRYNWRLIRWRGFYETLVHLPIIQDFVFPYRIYPRIQMFAAAGIFAGTQIGPSNHWAGYDDFPFPTPEFIVRKVGQLEPTDFLNVADDEDAFYAKRVFSFPTQNTKPARPLDIPDIRRQWWGWVNFYSGPAAYGTSDESTPATAVLGILYDYTDPTHGFRFLDWPATIPA